MAKLALQAEGDELELLAAVEGEGEEDGEGEGRCGWAASTPAQRGDMEGPCNKTGGGRACKAPAGGVCIHCCFHRDSRAHRTYLYLGMPAAAASPAPLFHNQSRVVFARAEGALPKHAITSEPTMMSQEARNLFLNGDKDSGLAAWKVRTWCQGRRACACVRTRAVLSRAPWGPTAHPPSPPLAPAPHAALPAPSCALRPVPLPRHAPLAACPPCPPWRSAGTTGRRCRCLARRRAAPWSNRTSRWAALLPGTDW